MPAYNFGKYIETDDVKYLFDGNVDESLIDKAKDAFYDVYEKFLVVIEDKAQRIYFNTYRRLTAIRVKFEVITKLIIELNEETNLENQANLIRTLTKYGINYDVSKPKSDAIMDMVKQRDLLKNEISILEADLEQSKSKGAQTNIIQTKIKLERALQMTINLKAISVEDFAYLVKEVKELNSDGKQDRRGRK